MNQRPSRFRTLQDYGVIALAIFVVLGLYQSFAPSGPNLPDEAPPLSLPQPTGETWSLEAMRGQVVVVNFWASWCGPCRSEMPAFARFVAAHPDVPVVSVSVDDGDLEALSVSARSLGITWPVVLADAATRRAWDVSTLPTTVVVGPDGRIWKTHVGGISERELEKAVQPPS